MELSTLFLAKLSSKKACSKRKKGFFYRKTQIFYGLKVQHKKIMSNFAAD